jgi:hypothetical protein
MNPLLIAPILELGKGIIDRFLPDPVAKAQAEMEMLKLLQEGELKTILAQLEINAKEAEHQSIFVAGWRPFVGWGCGFGFLYSSILHNLLSWMATAKGWPVPPAVNDDILLYVLGGMLGIAGMRTFEKTKGVTK